MCSVYEYQFPIFHAKLMLIGLWLITYTCEMVYAPVVAPITLGKGIYIENYYNLVIPLDFVFLFYSFFMLKGVSNYYLIRMFSLFEFIFNNLSLILG